MEIQTLRSYQAPPETYMPRYAGNQESDEPFKIHHRPLIRGLQLEWFKVSGESAEMRKEAGNDPAALYSALIESDQIAQGFRDRFIRAHVVGASGLTDGGEPIELESLHSLLIDVAELGGEVITHILLGGQMSEDEGKA